MRTILLKEKRKLVFFLFFSIFPMDLYSNHVYNLYRFSPSHMFPEANVLFKYLGTKSLTKSQDQSNASEVEIVFWISHTSPPSSGRQRLMKEMVDKMNLEFESSCSDEVFKKLGTDFRCKFGMKSDNISDADAVVFFMFLNGYKLSELPNLYERRLSQLWVMFALEPPTISVWKDPLRNIMNLTMTNRMDSDVWAPYGTTSQQSSSNQTFITIANTSLENWISGKSKFVVGVTSNCHTKSRREKLISQMNQTGTGQFDTFGKCGKSPTCGRWEDDCSKFWDKIGKEYKFFLAFENSLCKDYITEKFWRSLTVGMVPVVYGVGEYKIEAPPKSYIDVNDFPTVERLMTYLKVLDKDNKLYSKYFEWRASYKINTERHAWSTHGWCNLCKVVRHHKRRAGNSGWKTYENLQWWYKHQSESNESVCVNPPSKFSLK